MGNLIRAKFIKMMQITSRRRRRRRSQLLFHLTLLLLLVHHERTITITVHAFSSPSSSLLSSRPWSRYNLGFLSCLTSNKKKEMMIQPVHGSILSFVSDNVGTCNKLRMISRDTDSLEENQAGGQDLIELSNRFNRWRFLQEFLDGDASPNVVNIVLYRALKGASDEQQEQEKEKDVAEMSMEKKERIRHLLSDYSMVGRIPITGLSTSSMNSNFDRGDADVDAEVKTLSMQQQLELLEKLLPDPIKNEDDHKSAWDTVMEIHGKESVKNNESDNPVSMDWKVSNTVSRLLIHYGFLQSGIR